MTKFSVRLMLHQLTITALSHEICMSINLLAVLSCSAVPSYFSHSCTGVPSNH